ncbi:MAG: carboxypeptidase-like regulatory domain-containing protein [Aridibacter sp.]
MTIFLLAGVTVFAQATKSVGGKVEMKKEDGSTVPVKDAVVDLIRVDKVGRLPENKTDETGSFVFPEVPEGGVYALSISGAGLTPEIITDVKAGMDSFTIPVTAGDSNRYSEEQVRLSYINSIKESGKLTDEQKKMLKDFEDRKLNSDQKFAAVTKAEKEGNAAFESKNYDVAIAKFEEGFKANPEFIGSAPVFLNNKATAIIQRATDNYNTEVKSSDPKLKSGATDKIASELADALEAVVISYNLLKDANSADIADQKKYKENMTSAENIAKDALRILSQLKLNLPSSTEEQANRSVKIYKDLLTMLPKNPDVYAGLGLTFYSVGSLNNNMSQKQESVNYMAHFMEISPKDHKMREVISELYDYIIKEEKLKPQKIN